MGFLFGRGKIRHTALNFFFRCSKGNIFDCEVKNL